MSSMLGMGSQNSYSSNQHGSGKVIVRRCRCRRKKQPVCEKPKKCPETCKPKKGSGGSNEHHCPFPPCQYPHPQYPQYPPNNGGQTMSPTSQPGDKNS